MVFIVSRFGDSDAAFILALFTRMSLKTLFEKLRAPHVFEQLHEKRDLREALWRQYNYACECARKTLMVGSNDEAAARRIS